MPTIAASPPGGGYWTGAGTSLFLLFRPRRTQQTPPMIANARMAIPPTTPPTIAPIGTFFGGGGGGIGDVDVTGGDVVGEVVVVTGVGETRKKAGDNDDGLSDVGKQAGRSNRSPPPRVEYRTSAPQRGLVAALSLVNKAR
jgi:hypothetical protein